MVFFRKRALRLSEATWQKGNKMTYLDYADQLILAVGTPGLIRIAMAYRLDPRELISRYWIRGQREADAIHDLRQMLRKI
jgi:hypothetical protein